VEWFFEKEDSEDSLYLIVLGKIRVHDGGHTLNELGDRDVVGEMTLLDLTPRSALITAIEDTRLLYPDHESFYEVIDMYSKTTRGVIRILSVRPQRKWDKSSNLLRDT